MPGAGSSSYSVTTGPGRALMISPRRRNPPARFRAPRRAPRFPRCSGSIRRSPSAPPGCSAAAARSRRSTCAASVAAGRGLARRWSGSRPRLPRLRHRPRVPALRGAGAVRRARRQVRVAPGARRSHRRPAAAGGRSRAAPSGSAAMDDPAERDRRALFFLLEFLRLAMDVLGEVALRTQPEASDHARKRSAPATPKIDGQHDPADAAEMSADQHQRQVSAWRRRSRRPGRSAAASRWCAAGRRQRRKRGRGPRSRSRTRISTRPNGRCVSMRQPQIAIGSTSTIEARPNSCIDRSAMIAPGRPSRLRTGESVA